MVCGLLKVHSTETPLQYICGTKTSWGGGNYGGGKANLLGGEKVEKRVGKQSSVQAPLG